MVTQNQFSSLIQRYNPEGQGLVGGSSSTTMCGGDKKGITIEKKIDI